MGGTVMLHLFDRRRCKINNAAPPRMLSVLLHLRVETRASVELDVVF
jgi:hypothetical protein